MAKFFERACNIGPCWRGAVSIERYGELEWLCTIHLINCYRAFLDIVKYLLDIVNTYLRDGVVVTGENNLVLIDVRLHKPIGGGAVRVAHAWFRQLPSQARNSVTTCGKIAYYVVRRVAGCGCGCDRATSASAIFSHWKFGVCSPRALFCRNPSGGPHYVTPPAHNTDHQRHPTPHETRYHARCNQMAIHSQLFQARDTIFYDTRNHIRHPKKSRSTNTLAPPRKRTQGFPQGYLRRRVAWERAAPGWRRQARWWKRAPCARAFLSHSLWRAASPRFTPIPSKKCPIENKLNKKPITCRLYFFGKLKTIVNF